MKSKSTTKEIVPQDDSQNASEKNKRSTTRSIFEAFSRNQIQIPIISAMCGFVFSILLLNYQGCKPRESVFGDLYFSDTKDTLISFMNEKIHNLIAAKKWPVSIPFTSIPGDTKEFLVRKRKAIAQTIKERDTLFYGNPDTSLNYLARYFITTKESIISAINSKSRLDTAPFSDTIQFTIFDTCSILSDTATKKIVKVILKQKENQSLLEFSNKYPSFGLWLIFGIAQVMAWFSIASLLIGQIYNIEKIYTNAKVARKFLESLLSSVLLPSIVMLIFVYFLYKILIRSTVIGDYFFLYDYNNKMVIYAIPGYFIATICFSIYLFLAEKLDGLNKYAKDNNKLAVLATPANQVIPGMPVDPAVIAKPSPMQDQFDTLKRTFQGAFLGSAIILSLYVLWIGILFRGVNSLQPMRYYSLLSGRPFLEYDLVYLIGIMHTILLLIFYIPVKFKFNSMELNQTSSVGTGSTTSNSNSILNGLFQSIGAILITASPLIAGLVQNLVSNFLK